MWEFAFCVKVGSWNLGCGKLEFEAEKCGIWELKKAGYEIFGPFVSPPSIINRLTREQVVTPGGL